jgi:hypothetical protein
MPVVQLKLVLLVEIVELVVNKADIHQVLELMILPVVLMQIQVLQIVNHKVLINQLA